MSMSEPYAIRILCRPIPHTYIIPNYSKKAFRDNLAVRRKAGHDNVPSDAQFEMDWEKQMEKNRANRMRASLNTLSAKEEEDVELPWMRMDGFASNNRDYPVFSEADITNIIIPQLCKQKNIPMMEEHKHGAIRGHVIRSYRDPKTKHVNTHAMLTFNNQESKDLYKRMTDPKLPDSERCGDVSLTHAFDPITGLPTVMKEISFTNKGLRRDAIILSHEEVLNPKEDQMEARDDDDLQFIRSVLSEMSASFDSSSLVPPVAGITSTNAFAPSSSSSSSSSSSATTYLNSSPSTSPHQQQQQQQQQSSGIVSMDTSSPPSSTSSSQSDSDAQEQARHVAILKAMPDDATRQQYMDMLRQGREQAHRIARLEQNHIQQTKATIHKNFNNLSRKRLSSFVRALAFNAFMQRNNLPIPPALQYATLAASEKECKRQLYEMFHENDPTKVSEAKFQSISDAAHQNAELACRDALFNDVKTYNTVHHTVNDALSRMVEDPSDQIYLQASDVNDTYSMKAATLQVPLNPSAAQLMGIPWEPQDASEAPMMHELNKYLMRESNTKQGATSHDMQQQLQQQQQQQQLQQRQFADEVAEIYSKTSRATEIEAERTAPMAAAAANKKHQYEHLRQYQFSKESLLYSGSL
jgi:hypothetical protein